VQAEHGGADAGRGAARVAIETATITVKAGGAVQAAPPAGPADLGSVAPAVINEPPGTRTSSESGTRVMSPP